MKKSQHLPQKYRLPIILCYLEGRTKDEAARLLKCPRGTIATRLARARERLHARLVRRGETLSAGTLATMFKEYAKLMENKYDIGRISKADYAQAKYEHLDAEIALEREKARP